MTEVGEALDVRPRRYSRRPVDRAQEPRSRADGLAPPQLTPPEILARLGLADAPPREQRRTVAKLAFDGRLPLQWLTVMRQAGWLPYDVDVDD